ncbi:MAG: alpha/beta fold hydrolase [Chloroflexi bacterium]|nr:MAG: alpha/beta fold hydrolase [Chloroflexota bacterium]
MTQTIPSTEPFFFPGSTQTGILLTHGFTGTPKEMRWMGEYLNREHGFTVLGVRLAGHATQPEDMIRSNYTDWLASVEDGFNLLSGAAKSIYLMGLSMGGILSLTQAARLPVRGVVAMSAPYKLPDDPRLRHIDWLARITPYMPKNTEEPGSGWFGDTWKDYHISYPANPLRSIGQLVKLIAEMQAALPKIKVPVLLIHSRDDDYVVKDSMPLIFEHLATPDKQMMWIEGAGHVITEEPGRERVYQAAADFVKRVELLSA